tara:strand:- start:690 stop:2156 length:1467 start_codon:yes stop_codon:yes gene_type:complete
MKRLWTMCLISCLPVILAEGHTFASKPNILFILLDDLGKEWINCYGGEGIETPHIDALAEGGMLFHNAYSMPQCTPSRVAFLTGQYPYRNGWVNHWDVPRWGVGYFDTKQYPSIARILQGAGYATGIAGKWQINDFREQPNVLLDNGFDDYCMWTGAESDPENPEHFEISSKRYWDPYIHTKKGSRTYPGEFGPDVYNRFVLDFISKNQERPFFMYYAMALPHTPFTTTPLHLDVSDKYEKHRAMVIYVDHLIGKVMDQLEALDLTRKTLVLFTSDNGTVTSLKNHRNGRLVRGGKMKRTENGVNAPFIAHWPSQVPAGVSTEALVDFTDMLPTFADLAEVSLSPHFQFDGSSFREVLLGHTEKSPRQWILAMGSHSGVATDQGIECTHRFRERVLRDERYKLFIDSNQRPEKLVDLSKDPEEQNDLKEQPEMAAVLDQLTAVAEGFPKQDNDPFYQRIPGYPSYPNRLNESVADPRKSQVHKVGRSD